ncbi:MAG: cobalamin-dependent protein [Lachnospiraceae bacterium]|nr:cobalamin-dependent protein [Lachnospiraceae bacterium]
MKEERVLLVRSHYDKRVASLEPLGLEYMMAAVKAEGLFCMIHDEGIHNSFGRFRRLLKVIDSNQITFVGFSTISNIAWYVIETIHKLKKARPNIKIMVGGAEVFINHEDFMIDDIDFVYYDHGLDSIRRAFRSGFELKELEQCPGLAYRKEGKWVENAKGEPISDYGILPDRSLFYENRKKYKVLAQGTFSVLKTAFSCPQNCNFCISRQFNACRYTTRKVEDVVDEIVNLDNDKIFIIDDDFLVDRERVLAICNQLIERNCKKTFMIFARADSIVKCKDIMPLLYQVGFREMLVGLEAVNDDTLSSYNKNSSVALNREAVKILREHKMVCVGLFVINYDFTHKNFMEINKFVKEEKLIWVLFSILIPFKGTVTYEENKHRLYKYKYKRTDGTYVLMQPDHLPKWLFKLEYHFLYYVNYPRIYLAGILGTFDKIYKNKGNNHESTPD